MLKRIKKMLTNDPVENIPTEEVAELKPMTPEPVTEDIKEVDQEPETDDDYISDEENILLKLNNISTEYYDLDKPLSNNKKEKTNLVKAFQRRFRQNLINGKPDKECLLISKNLLKN